MFGVLRPRLRAANADRVHWILAMLTDVARVDGQASFTHENCASLVLLLLNGDGPTAALVSGFSFSENALRFKRLAGVSFEDCFFAPTGLEGASMQSCSFSRCRFARLEASASTVLSGVHMTMCPVDAFTIAERGVAVFQPDAVRMELRRVGIIIEEAAPELPLEPAVVRERDENLTQAERVFRCFGRTTHISDNVIQRKLGSNANTFMDYVVPELIRSGVFVEITHSGRGSLRHFGLGIPMADLNRAIESSGGSFAAFLEAAGAHA